MNTYITDIDSVLDVRGAVDAVSRIGVLRFKIKNVAVVLFLPV